MKDNCKPRDIFILNNREKDRYFETIDSNLYFCIHSDMCFLLDCKSSMCITVDGLRNMDRVKKNPNYSSHISITECEKQHETNIEKNNRNACPIRCTCKTSDGDYINPYTPHNASANVVALHSAREKSQPSREQSMKESDISHSKLEILDYDDFAIAPHHILLQVLSFGLLYLGKVNFYFCFPSTRYEVRTT
ncbi:LOW QUALITY PROTEIN: hypothetical protein Cgig2_008696 [Carnegiea gigantea]|uniref:Uncharacterized protein n=1 Tax=Carnegiea gigantea TaxID=171969 RepID=A0A9Q1JM17_9CARY|nr:LOW QUALITY PROTEIN: hypothetical protein Cgig2_008696 [Carnegiea gigantea]